MKRTLDIRGYEIRVEYDYLPGDANQAAEIEIIEVQTDPIVDSNDTAEQLHYYVLKELFEIHSTNQENYHGYYD